MDVSTKIDAVGDLSHLLNEAVIILDGKMGEDEVVSALADLVTQSRQLSGCVLIDRRDAQRFTKDIAEWIEEQLLERLQALDQSHSKVRTNFCFCTKSVTNNTREFMFHVTMDHISI